MYNRYIRSDGGTYTRISAEDTPLPPPERRLFPGVAASAEHGASDGGVPGAA